MLTLKEWHVMDTDRGRIVRVIGGYQVPAGLRDDFVRCVKNYPTSKSQIEVHTETRVSQRPHQQIKRTF